MKEILLGIIKNVDNKRGEAVIEFLLALATKRMKLVQSDMKELEKFMKQDEINNKFKDKRIFCLKLIEIALD
jgi:Zn-dependent oligopeptidase